MAKEIEYKFLLNGEGWREHAVRRVRMVQGYLASASNASVRARIAGDQAWVNIKIGAIAAVRHEFEYAVPVADAEAMLTARGGPTIEKTRHIVPFDGFEWEIDEFHGANTGLVVAEIELEYEGQVFPRPPWMGGEVTHLTRYYNVKLVEHPYCEWSDEERAERGA